MSDVHAWADQLRQYATHSAPRDWEYTRDSQIRHIRMDGDWSGYNSPLARVRRLIARFGRSQPWERGLMGRGFKWRHPIITVQTTLRTDRHQPDGVLDGGNIITQWEETGEYLQYVQPSVGAMLADWMDDEPDSPHAQRIAAEMKRINGRYGARIAAEGGDS